MLSASVADLRRRAERYCAAIPEATAVESDAYVGGGASPQTRIPSIAMAIVIEKPNTFAAHLRRAKPPIVARVDGSRVLLDLRTIAPVEDADVIAALRRHNA